MEKLFLLMFLAGIFLLCGCSDEVTSDESEITWESYLNNTKETSKATDGR